MGLDRRSPWISNRRGEGLLYDAWPLRRVCYLIMTVFAGCQLGRTIFVVPIQSHVAHAVHWLRAVPAAVIDRHVVDHVVHDKRSHVLRPVPGTRNQSDTELGFITPTVSRKGLWQQDPGGRVEGRYLSTW